MTLVQTAVLLLPAIAVALAALIAAPRPALGCSPPYPPISLSDYAAETEVAFAGRQIARIRPNDPSYHSALSRSDGITLIFEVERVFKGQAGPLLAARTGYGKGGESPATNNPPGTPTSVLVREFGGAGCGRRGL